MFIIIKLVYLIFCFIFCNSFILNFFLFTTLCIIHYFASPFMFYHFATSKFMLHVLRDLPDTCFNLIVFLNIGEDGKISD